MLSHKISLKFDDQEKTNILQNQFSIVFIHEPEGDMPHIARRTDSSISVLYVTEEMVLNQLTNLNVNKSCGPDEIHPRILIQLADYIAGPVAILYNLTIQSGSTVKFYCVVEYYFIVKLYCIVEFYDVKRHPSIISIVMRTFNTSTNNNAP